MAVSVPGVVQVGDRRGAVAVRREGLRLRAARPAQEQPFAADRVGARLGHDVERGTRGPAELGGERVRKDRDLLNGAHWHGGQHGLAAPRFVVARAVEHERGRAAAAGGRDEVGRVDEEVAGAFALPERGVEERQGRDLAAEDRNFVDGRAVETAADLRVRPHALFGAVDDDLRLAAACDECDPDRRGLAGAQREARCVVRVEAGLGDVHRIGTRQRKRRERRRAVRAGHHVPGGAGRRVDDRDVRVLDDAAGLIDDDDQDGRSIRGLRESNNRHQQDGRHDRQDTLNNMFHDAIS